MKRSLLFTALAAGIIVSAGSATVAPAVASGPPTRVDETPFVLDNCGFDVVAQLTGKTKTIELPDGGLIISSPGQKVTLSAHGKTVNYVITGTSHVQFLADRIEVKQTGRNVLLLPAPDGLFLTVGNVNFALNLDGSEQRRFSGSGQVTDVCAVLE